MKVRTDFVTNSSSSSFILAFSNEDSVRRELVDGFPDWALGRVGTVLKDVEEAKRLTKEDVVEKVKDEHRWWAGYNCYNKKYRYGHPTLSRLEWAETDEGEKEIAAYLESVVEETKVKMDGKSVFVEVEYDDHCNSDLENEIMPELPFTIIRFSHH